MLKAFKNALKRYDFHEKYFFKFYLKRALIKTELWRSVFRILTVLDHCDIGRGSTGHGFHCTTCCVAVPSTREVCSRRRMNEYKYLVSSRDVPLCLCSKVPHTNPLLPVAQSRSYVFDVNEMCKCVSVYRFFTHVLENEIQS